MGHEGGARNVTSHHSNQLLVKFFDLQRYMPKLNTNCLKSTNCRLLQKKSAWELKLGIALLKRALERGEGRGSASNSLQVLSKEQNFFFPASILITPLISLVLKKKNWLKHLDS
jgi:hypothetical protein